MLSTNQIRQAQKNYYLYTAFNIISISLLAGNILFLYAIRLGADTRLIGFLSALSSITFLFSPIGRRIAHRLGAVKTKGYFWLARYLIMGPVLLTLIPVFRDSPVVALSIVTIGYFGFNFFKGIATAGDKPIQGHISRTADRASFISMSNIILFSGQIMMGLLMAALMGKESPLFIYGVFILAGIITGAGASWFTLKLPEPGVEGSGIPVSLGKSVREGLRRPEFSNLFLLVMFSNLGIGMSLGFIVVYAKEVYAQPDNMVVYFTVAGSLGALAMAGIMHFLTDRIGAKPVYFFFNALRLVLLMPLVWAPSLNSVLGTVLFLCFSFFLEQMTYWGFHATADVYFLATSRAQDRLDLGIFFNMTRGLFGMIGSLGGGFLLSWLQSRYGPGVIPFRIFFAVSSLFFLANLLVLARLPGISSLSIPDALGLMMNPSGLRAIHYLNRLQKSSTYEEERGIVLAMARNRSRLTLRELQRLLDSPNFFIRMEALVALQNFPTERRTVELLLEQIERHTFTTAHIAARLVGEIAESGGLAEEDLKLSARTVLMRALGSGDYLLKSKAALSLAYLKVDEAFDRILSLLQYSDNPREILYFIKALEVFGDRRVLPVLLLKIEKNPNPYIENDLVLSAAGLMGFGAWFYSRYCRFLQDPVEGLDLLKGEMEESGHPDALGALIDSIAQPHFTRSAADFLAGLEKNGEDEETRDLIRTVRSYVETAGSTISTNIRFLILACLTFLHSSSPVKPTVRPKKTLPVRKVRAGGTARYQRL